MMTNSEAIEPSEFDVVVLGTGLVESLVAAAAAKAGQTVLQLDPATFYGSSWTSLQLDEYLQALEGTGIDTYSSASERLGLLQQSISHAHVERDGNATLGNSGEYGLDIGPKVLYGAGPLIGLLLGSGAHNYTEFKLVQGSYLYDDGKLRSVPSSRSEVFKDRSLSLAQKRSLMKFLKGCTEALSSEGALQGCFDDRPFVDLMHAQGLEPKLQALVLHAVLMLDHAQHCTAGTTAAKQQGGQMAASRQVPSVQGAGDTAASTDGATSCAGTAGPAANGGVEVTCLQCPAPTIAIEAASRDLPPGSEQVPQLPVTAAAALRLMDVHMRSLGRYGQDAGPFLTPMYGCGELPQAFCRVAAVAGAIQVLRCPVEGPIFDEHTFSCTGVELGTGQVIRCQHLVAGQDFLHEWLCTFHPETQSTAVHRCTAILDAPLVPGEQQFLLVMPPESLSSAVHAVRGLVVSNSTKACPQDRCILYLWTPAADSAVSALEVLQPALEALVDTSHLAASCQGGQQQQRTVSLSEDAPEQQQQLAGTERQLAEREQMQQQVPMAAVREPSKQTFAAGTEAKQSSGSSPGEQRHPRALLAAFYTYKQIKITDYTSSWPSNTVLCPGPDCSATYLAAVEDAKGCFARLYPEVQPFPLEPHEPESDADVASDDEALEALEAALGKLPAANNEEEQT